MDVRRPTRRHMTRQELECDHGEGGARRTDEAVGSTRCVPHPSRLSAERHPDPDLPSPQGDGVRERVAEAQGSPSSPPTCGISIPSAPGRSASRERALHT